jgi:NAD+ kinase
MTTMRAVGLVPNTDREVAGQTARATVAALELRGVEVRIPAGAADALGLERVGVDEGDFAKDLDLVLSIGGDGTILYTVGLVHPEPVPILGVNAGHLGYLTALEAADLDGALDQILAGDFHVTERTLVECRIDGASVQGTWFGLNDVAIEKLDAGRIVRLEVAIAGAVFTTYAADGVVVATPTGTTAYTFSLRGPIVSPQAHLLVLTPVSPHMLFDRSLVLAPDEELQLTVTGRPVALQVDGCSIAHLEQGDRIICRAADSRVRLVAPRDMAFHQILKAKFSLPDR